VSLFDVRVLGAERLAESTRRAGRELQVMHEGNTQAGEHVAAAARRNAPRLTGTLMGSVFVAVEPDRFTVGTMLRYGAVQEYGSRKRNITPRPWMRPALQANQEQVLTDLRNDTQRILDHVRGV
jgi:phage gpG-like protein